MGDIIARIDALLANTPQSEVEEFEVTRCLRDARDELIAASTLTGVMLEGTGQRMAEGIAERVMGGMTVGAWLSVEERLPELDERVMIGNAADGWVSVGSRQLTGEYHHWDGDDSEELHEPTHWMPLPEPPEVK